VQGFQVHSQGWAGVLCFRDDSGLWSIWTLNFDSSLKHIHDKKSIEQ
jgi:hypothetical protein